MKFVNSYQDKDDYIYEYDLTDDELNIIKKVEEDNHMSIQDITTSWLRWLIDNPKHGTELLLKWKQEQDSLNIDSK